MQFLWLGGLDDVQGHFDQVVCSVGIDSARLVDESLVLDRVWVKEETLTGETGHFGPGNELLVLEDDLAKFLVGSTLGVLRERQH